MVRAHVRPLAAGPQLDSILVAWMGGRRNVDSPQARSVVVPINGPASLPISKFSSGAAVVQYAPLSDGFFPNSGSPDSPSSKMGQLQRLNSVAKHDPKAVLGVIEFWLGPQKGEGERRGSR